MAFDSIKRFLKLSGKDSATVTQRHSQHTIGELFSGTGYKSVVDYSIDFKDALNSSSGWILHNFINIKSKDCCKNGRTVLASDTNDANKVSDIDVFASYEDKIKLWTTLENALKNMIIDGYCGIFIVTNQLDYTQELNVNEQLIRLQIITKNQIQLDSQYKNYDLTSDLFNNYDYYNILSNNSVVKVHNSRLILVKSHDLVDNSLPLTTNVTQLVGILEKLKADMLQASLKGNLDVIKLQGYNDKLSDNRQAGSLAADVARLSAGMRNRTDYKHSLIFLDAEDDYISVDKDVTKYTAAIDNLIPEISGACGIPVTKLFGQSAKGFSTGEEDTQNYYSGIKASQESYLRPVLSQLDPFLWQQATSKQIPDDFTFDFNTLYEQDEVQKATALKIHTERLNSIYENDVIGLSTYLRELENQGCLATTNELDRQRVKELDEQPAVNELDTINTDDNVV